MHEKKTDFTYADTISYRHDKNASKSCIKPNLSRYPLTSTPVDETTIVSPDANRGFSPLPKFVYSWSTYMKNLTKSPNKTPRRSPEKRFVDEEPLTLLPPRVNIKKYDYSWKHTIISCIPAILVFLLLLFFHKPQHIQEKVVVHENNNGLTTDQVSVLIDEKLIKFSQQLEILNRMTSEELATLRTLIDSNNVAKDEEVKKIMLRFESKISDLRIEFFKRVEEIQPSTQVKADLSELELAIEKAIARYDADKTGLADYAIGSAGASVASVRCTETFTGGAATFRFFGIPLASFANSPASVLQPGTLPGHCWAFKGSEGSVIIKLAVPVRVTSVSVEHIHRRLVYNGRLDSAPREFRVLALPTPDVTQDDNSVAHLGSFTFDATGPSIQYFPIAATTGRLRFIEFHFLNNHGHPLYTCIYRLRVHGISD